MTAKSLIAPALLYGIPSAVVVGLIALVLRLDQTPPKEEGTDVAEQTTREIAMSCTTDMATQFHIHPWLTIRIDGVAQVVPADIGIANGCMNPLHTHDADGEIHVESPVQRDFTLGDFFAVWDKPLDAFGTLTRMTVNGTESTEGENLVFKDDDKIELEYATK